MNQPVVQAVLFDLDGTLVDSAPDLTAAVDRVLLEQGRAAVDGARLAAVVSKGGRAMLQVAFPDLDAVAREELLPRFLAYYAQNIAVASRPYDGIEMLLTRIEAQGMRWGVVTNKPEAMACKLMSQLGLLPRCQVLVGGDTLAQRKPDPEPLWHACTQLGVKPENCVYVGDDERDALAARAAGMPAVVALWGYHPADENPLAWPAVAHCSSPYDLLHLDFLGLVDVAS